MSALPQQFETQLAHDTLLQPEKSQITEKYNKINPTHPSLTSDCFVKKNTFSVFVKKLKTHLRLQASLTKALEFKKKKKKPLEIAHSNRWDTNAFSTEYWIMNVAEHMDSFQWYSN